MDTPLAATDAIGARGRAAWTTGLTPALARATLTTAFLVGLAGDALLRDGPLGIAFPLWIAILAVNLVSLGRRGGRRSSREAILWLAAAVLFALGTAWRNADELAALDVLATAFSLGMAAVSFGRTRAGLLAPRLRETIGAFARVGAAVATGVFALVLREARLEDIAVQHGRRGVALVRGALVAAVLLALFGSLLRAADPIFASFVSLPAIDAGLLASHVVVIGFLTWITAGWARASVFPRTDPLPTIARTFRLSPGDALTALATLDLLFATFVLAQLGWLFGGDGYLRGRTGLTVAEYARHGFFQMVWVVGLVIPMLVITRTTLPGDRVARRRHTAVALPLVALVAAIMASAAVRLKLYVHFYGLTTDRVYALVFLAWLAAVVAWLGATVLRDRGRRFGAGAVLSGLAALAALNVADPDAIVGRINVARAARFAPAAAAPTLDIRHLATLRGAAVPIAVREVLRPSRLEEGSPARTAEDADRCDGARALLHRYGPASMLATARDRDGAWRSWNADDAGAMDAVIPNSAALRRVMHASCRPGQR